MDWVTQALVDSAPGHQETQKHLRMVFSFGLVGLTLKPAIQALPIGAGMY